MIWILRTALLAAWIAMVFVSVRAITGDVFFADFAHPWRAQFNTDLILHLGLVGGWIAWREKRLVTGIPFAILSVMMGGVFTLAYMLVRTFTTKGDMRAVLLGEQRV